MKLFKKIHNTTFFSQISGLKTIPLKVKFFHHNISKIPDFKAYGSKLTHFMESQSDYPQIDVFHVKKVPYGSDANFLHLPTLPTAYQQWLTALSDEEIQTLKNKGFNVHFIQQIDKAVTDYAITHFPYIDVLIKEEKPRFQLHFADHYLQFEPEDSKFGVRVCQRINIFDKGFKNAIKSYEESKKNKLDVFDRQQLNLMQPEMGYSSKDINLFSIDDISKAVECKLTRGERSLLKRRGYSEELIKNFNQRLIQYEKLNDDGKIFIDRGWGESTYAYRDDLMAFVQKDLQEEGVIKFVSDGKSCTY